MREAFPDLKIRLLNLVHLFCLTPEGEHPHGLSDSEFDSPFTTDKPIIFIFHGYPWLVHRLACRPNNHRNLHARGYIERGGINTPRELAIDNRIDRFSLAVDMIGRVPRLQVVGARARQAFVDRRIECRQYAHTHGVDLSEINDRVWPYG